MSVLLTQQILRYCKKSQISNKVGGNWCCDEVKSSLLVLQLNGFVDRYFDTDCGVEPRSDPTPTPAQSTGAAGGGGAAVEGNPRQMNSPLMLIETFLQALTNTDSDGRIVVTRNGASCHQSRESPPYVCGDFPLCGGFPL